MQTGRKIAGMTGVINMTSVMTIKTITEDNLKNPHGHDTGVGQKLNAIPIKNYVTKPSEINRQEAGGAGR